MHESGSGRRIANGSAEYKRAHTQKESAFTEIMRGLGVVTNALGSPTLPGGIIPSAVPAALMTVGTKGLVGNLMPRSTKTAVDLATTVAEGAFIIFKDYKQLSNTPVTYRRGVLLNMVTELITYLTLNLVFNPEGNDKTGLWIPLLTLGLLIYAVDTKKQVNGEYLRRPISRLVPEQERNYVDVTIDESEYNLTPANLAEAKPPSPAPR